MKKYFYIGLGIATGFLVGILLIVGLLSYCSTRNMDRVMYAPTSQPNPLVQIT
jgi:hypothetical protein